LSCQVHHRYYRFTRKLEAKAEAKAEVEVESAPQISQMNTDFSMTNYQ